jgi:GWxTD domain-containing protein
MLLKTWTVAVLALFPAVSTAGQVAEGASPPLEVGVARFYRSAGRQTVVDGFCRIPFALLDPLSRGSDGQAVYRVTVSVRDSANLELVRQTWTRSVPARFLSAARSSTVEHFTFAAMPGAYSVEVTVRDSATGRTARRQLRMTSYPAVPAASDLLLATALRLVTGADSVPRSGELRKGSVIIEAADRPLLTPRQAQIGYYLERYAQAPETAAVSIRVARATGERLVTTAAQQVPFAAGGGATRGMVDLAGLPPGDYSFEVVVQGRDTLVTRQAPFRMGGLESAVAAEAVDAADKFAAMSEAQLDTLYAPLVYLMASDEVGIYGSLTLDGKRGYLRWFWGKRDPTPGTPRNEAQEDFYSRIAEANRRFREGGAAEIPGWRTDRGRIFIKYGPPQDVLQRPQAGSTAPYEVWKYTRGRLSKYVFLDQTQFGNYALIWTDDRREVSRPNWQALLGPEAVQDVERF